MKKRITRKEYMASSGDLHLDYYSQFITEATKSFVLRNVGAEKIKSSNCPHLNDVVEMRNNSWIWDKTPINTALAQELGETPSQSTRTCVGKAFAQSLRQ